MARGTATVNVAGAGEVKKALKRFEEEQRNTEDLLAQAIAVARERKAEAVEWKKKALLWQNIATAERADLRRILAGSSPAGFEGALAYDEMVGE